ncbi:MAG TPA: hypothetical protein VFJ43_02595, partial [Bacteroidia bacterium]|nr:hypothetical protein [Bacteroidia bacterium]
NDLAKTYLRALHKGRYRLDETEIEGYLISKLNWEKRYSDDIIEIVRKLNDGRSFKGGSTTGLSPYTNQWERECNE